MTEDIRNIITLGTHAPSGENCQPWKFVIRGDTVDIFNVPEADQSLYNFAQRGSYVSHGALLENISIAAAQGGYDVGIKIFPASDPVHVSRVIFKKNQPKNEPLYPYIEKRCTNRKDHKPIKLTADEKSALMAAGSDAQEGNVTILDEKQSLDLLGHALAVNEHVLFENKHLHDFFYNHLFWERKDEDKAGGFYIKTLEFLPHQVPAVRLFKNWNILNFLNKIGHVSQKIAKENGEKYARSGALMAIVAAGSTDADFVRAGMLAERVWLTATKLGLAVQPCTGVLYFMERIRGGDEKVFSPDHVKLIREAYAAIETSFGVAGRTIPMLFRIGHADPPTARAMRMPPSISVV